jgi:hypothetical protein
VEVVAANRPIIRGDTEEALERLAGSGLPVPLVPTNAVKPDSNAITVRSSPKHWKFRSTTDSMYMTSRRVDSERR